MAGDIYLFIYLFYQNMEMLESTANLQLLS